MTQNKLKIIACISMLIDHIGYMLFPHILILRCIGRIAMPLFAFFIAEGCFYTRSRGKYFLGIFSLALICQAVYFVEDLINGGVYNVSLNILFTFALSIAVCFAFLDFKESLEGGARSRQILSAAVFAAVLLAAFACTNFLPKLSVPVYFDYGFAGVMLPLFALIFKERVAQLTMFFVGLIIFNASLFSALWYTWFSLLAMPLLALYNGKRGTKKLKYVFYLFYPVHFALLYLLSYIL